MKKKGSTIILIRRLVMWALYFFAGIILYSNKGSLNSFLITYSRIVYPLSIFWLQITLKKRTNFLLINSKMSTAQLWFNLLPVVASLLTVLLSLTNLLLYILENLLILKFN